jgi:putative NIF3 family GTP cyclohydrolase 1 type 2
MHIRAFIGEMERLAPPVLAEEFDQGRIGLIIEGRPDINRVCCALDATPVVVERAAAASADMLVVHHTPLWTPVTQVTGRTARILRTVLAAEMNLYVMHTNFDRAEGGVNDALCRLLGLTETVPMSAGKIGTFGAAPKEISRRIGGNVRIGVPLVKPCAGSPWLPGAVLILSCSKRHRSRVPMHSSRQR